MGDAPVAYIEGVGGIRVSEDDVVEAGKNDVSARLRLLHVDHICVLSLSYQICCTFLRILPESSFPKMMMLIDRLIYHGDCRFCHSKSGEPRN